jgi:hypothetical protein
MWHVMWSCFKEEGRMKWMMMDDVDDDDGVVLLRFT